MRAPVVRLALGELVVDSFAGGGGASQGIEMALGRSPDIAINHDAEAIAMHAANHPDSRHFCEDVWAVDPVEATGGQPVGLMWLSPDCKHFSKAKGGKPVSKKIRGLAWVAVRWAKAVKPRVIVLENVEEFQTWGPVLENGQPCPAQKGLTFRRFVGRLKALGYAVDYEVLRACDYGAPTIRKRLFLVARCDGRPIVWPKPTHGKGLPQPWRAAAECIDWSIPCPSIFERARPLADNTLRRIANGLRKFVIESPRPFIVNMAHGGKEEDILRPLSTIATEKGGCRALIAPTLVQTGYGEREGQAPRSLDLEKPLGTIVGSQKHALVAAHLSRFNGDRIGSDLADPTGTVIASSQKHALVSAFLARHFTGVDGSTLFAPVPTVTAIDHHSLVASSLVTLRGTGESQIAASPHSLNAPLGTISGGGIHHAEVRAFLVAYFGNEQDGGDLFDPMRTVTSRDRFGLVTVEGIEYAIADIGMRMLQPRELYRAQGFPDSYRIDIPFRGKPLTKTAQVRMCGNSVVPQLAAAIVAAQFTDHALTEAA